MKTNLLLAFLLKPLTGHKAMKQRLLYIALACLLPLNSTAGPVTSAPMTIEEVWVVVHGGFLIKFTSEVNAACTTIDTKTVYFYAGQEGVTVEGVQALLSAALTAHVARRQIKIVYNDSYVQCWGDSIHVQ